MARNLLYNVHSIRKYQAGSTIPSNNYMQGVEEDFSNHALFKTAPGVYFKQAQGATKPALFTLPPSNIIPPKPPEAVATTIPKENKFSTAFKLTDTVASSLAEYNKNNPKAVGTNGAGTMDTVAKVGNSFLSGKGGGKDIVASAGDKALSIGGQKGGISGAMGSSTAGGITAGVGAVGGMVGGALKSAFNDGKATTYTKKEAFGNVAGNAMEMAATGAQFGPWGAAAGLVVGVAKGLIENKKNKKLAQGLALEETNAKKSEENAALRNENSFRESAIASGPASTSDRTYGMIQQGYGTGYRTAKLGGTFHFTMPIINNENRFARIPKNMPAPIFKRGGVIKPTENIIPNGVLHEEDNKLGDKGMPVVKCNNNSCEKKYEIERDEMILTLDTTKKIEDLIKKGKLEDAGKFIKDQILNNTHSYTEKFTELNNYSSNVVTYT